MRSNDDRIFAAIAHIAIIFDLLGLIVGVIIFIMKGKESTFINFSAKQAIGWQIIGVIIQKVVAFLTIGSFVHGIHMGLNPIRGVFGLFSINGIIGLFFTIVAIFGAIKALSGETYRYPLIGDFVERI